MKSIADELGLKIRNFESIESDKNLNHYDFYYESVVGDRVINAIPSYVKLETSLMSYAFPTEERELGNYIFEALENNETELIKKYDLGIFTMRVQSLNRTLIDKIFAVCDYYLQGKAYRNDYQETTLKLISDSLEYEKIKNNYLGLVEKIF